MSSKNGAHATAGRSRSLGASAMALGALLLGLAVGATAIAQSGGDTYTVKKGDTLWGISAQKLGEAKDWKQIWEQNPQIKDPHWIYPGDQIQLAGGESVPVAVVEEAPMALPAEPGPESVRYSRSASAGFVSTGDFGEVGHITSSFHETDYLYAGLDVFVDKGADDGVRVGDWFVSFREDEPVVHPRTGKPAGYRVAETGHLRVVQVGKDSSRVRIERSFTYLQRGDSVTPFKPLPEEFIVHPAPQGVGGTILAQQDGRLEVGRDDLVYLDLGQNQGVDIGARLAVYNNEVPFEHGSAEGMGLPPNVVGEVVVLRASGESSTGLLTRSTDSIRVGDRVASLADLSYPASEAAAISTDRAFEPDQAEENLAFTVPSTDVE
ncbi:MAG: LysM domain-containing protein [Deltaproteobacteria bacterium]|nr:LysM domain-containing protein [Deltaproteobacteria bacterium]